MDKHEKPPVAADPQKVDAHETEAEQRNRRVHLLGRRMVQDGFLNEAQLQTAFAYQQEHDVLLSDALIALKIRTREELARFFTSDEKSLSGGKMVGGGLLTADQLTKVLNYQIENGGRLGKIVVALGYATQAQVDSFFQGGERPAKGDAWGPAGIRGADHAGTAEQRAGLAEEKRRQAGRNPGESALCDRPVAE